MRIGVVTKDKSRVAKYFTYTPRLLLFTIDENGEIIDEDEVKNPAYRHSREQNKKADSEDQRGRKLECDTLIVNHIEIGAYEHFKQAGTNIIITDEESIEEAMTLYLKGKLKSAKSYI